MFNKLVYLLGVKLRNPSLHKHLRFLKESDSWSLEKLQEYQFKRCKELMLFAYAYSPFYKSYFDLHGFDPNSFKDLAELNKLPPLKKATLITNGNAIQSTYPFKKLFHSKTSGTSGSTISFFKDESWDSCNRAALYRGWEWYNIKPWDRKAYLWGYNTQKKAARKVKVLDFLQNRFRLFNYDEEEIQGFIKKMKGADYLHGYSSMIYELAKRMDKLGIKSQFGFKAIFGTSEKIFDSYQEMVKRVFGQKIVSEYGAAESGLIAMECPEGNMHIVMENCVLQVEHNEIIVTNLMSGAFPIIRYSLGDEVVLAPEDFKCSCGRAHTVIKEITGRVGFKLYGKTKEYPSLSMTNIINHFVKKNGVLFNFQVIQEEKGVVVIKIEQGWRDLEAEFRARLAEYYGDEFMFNIVFNSKLHAMNGKFKDYITTLEQ